MNKKTKISDQKNTRTSRLKQRVPWLFGLEIKDLVKPITLRRIRILQAGVLLVAIAAAGYYVWDNYLRQPTGVELVNEMVRAAGGMEAWNNLQDGQFTRTQYLYSEAGEELSRKIQTFFFKKTDAGVKLLIRSLTRDGEEVWVGEDKDGHWATKADLPADPKRTARDLGMMCDSKYCQPSCATSMAFYRFSMPFKLTDYGVKPELAGTVPFNGGKARVLDVGFIPTVGKDRWVFYTDPEDHLIRKIEYHNRSDQGEARPEEMYWSDHQEVNGITFSHKWTRYWSNGKVMEEYIFSDVDFETSLADSFFDRPERDDWLSDTAN